MQQATDFVLYDEGDILLLAPQTDAATAWCEVHLPEDAPRLGPKYAVEHQYIADIVNGIEQDGLQVERRTVQ